MTTEVLAFPPGSGADDFDWRISIAEVTVTGPFSIFDGVDRVLTVLEGALDLRVDDGDDLRLDARSDPFAFPGDVPTLGSPVGSRVRDLNVMTRRGTCGATVERLAISAPGCIELGVPNWAVLLVLQRTTVKIDNWVVGLAPLDAVSLRASSRISVATGSCPLVVVKIDRSAPT